MRIGTDESKRTKGKMKQESPNKLVTITDIGLGDGTKGNATEWCTRVLHAHHNIRSGGCQALSNITRRDGTFFQLSHFPSGVLEGARAHLLHMTIFPTYLYQESLELEEKGVNNPLDKMTIDDECLVVTPFHGAYGRLMEISRGPNRKGTMGMGVGEAVKDSITNPELAIRAGEFLGNPAFLRKKVEQIQKAKALQAQDIMATSKYAQQDKQAPDELNILESKTVADQTVRSYFAMAKLVKIVGKNYLDTILAEEGAIVCETSQGALLHPRMGFVPYIAQTDSTGLKVLQTINEHEHHKQLVRLAVSRTYLVRHGYGPFVSYDERLADLLPETHNAKADFIWLGGYRRGYYDPIALRYGIGISGGKKSFSGLMISYMDVLQKASDWTVVTGYRYNGKSTENLKDFFTIEGDTITDIKVDLDDGTQTHLDRQMHLTALLKDCTPILKTLVPSRRTSLENVFLGFAEEQLQVPVVALGYGPTAEDRMIRRGHENLFT